MYKEPVKSMTFHSVWIWSTWRLIFLYIHTLINIIKIHYVSLFKWTLLKEIFLSLSVSKWFCSVVSDSDPMDCSLPGSSIHGIFKARVLEWVAIAFSRYTVMWFNYTYRCIYSLFFSHIGYYRILSRIPYAIQ